MTPKYMCVNLALVYIENLVFSNNVFLLKKIFKIFIFLIVLEITLPIQFCQRLVSRCPRRRPDTRPRASPL